MNGTSNWLSRLAGTVVDPVERQQAQGLWVMLFGTCIAGVLAFVAFPFILGPTPATMTLGAGAVLVVITSLVGMGVLRSGRFQAATLALSAGLLVTIGILAIAFGYPATTTILGTLFIPIVFSVLLRARLTSLIIATTAGAITILAFVLQPVTAPIAALVAPRGDLSILTITLFILTISVVWVALDVFGQALRAALARSQHDRTLVEEALHQARAQAEAQQKLNAELERTRAALQDLVASLETPSVNLASDVLLAPIVGQIDSRRAKALSARLLDEASRQRARLVILDVTGVPTVDTAVAQALLGVAQGLRLLGCQVALSGITLAVAITLTHEGVNLAGMATVRSPQEALAAHLQQIAG